MTPDKILEIARRYTAPEVREQQVCYDDGSPSRTLYSMTYWEFCEEELLSFAQAIIEAERDAHGITVPIAVWDKLKDVNTVSDLIRALMEAEKE